MKSKKSIREKNIIQIQDQLRELVDELHGSAHQVITPRYPLVLVFVLPKASMQGGIILPDQQNKPVHEGIVLTTWKPFFKQIVVTQHMEGQDKYYDEAEVLMEPNVKVGDHVLLPHAAGIPCWPLNMNQHSGLSTHGDFRLVRTDIGDVGGMMYGGIMGVLEYSVDDVQKQVSKIIASRRTDISCSATAENKKLVTRLLNDFVILDKALRPRTTSGLASSKTA